MKEVKCTSCKVLYLSFEKTSKSGQLWPKSKRSGLGNERSPVQSPGQAGKNMVKEKELSTPSAFTVHSL